MKRKTSFGRKLLINRGQIALHIIFIFLVVCYIVPLMLVVSAAFSTEDSLITDGFSLIPREFSTLAFKAIFRNPDQIIHSYQTTIIFSVVATILVVIIQGIMAYPLCRDTFVFRNVITFYAFFTTLFGAGMVPSYIVNTKLLHLNDTIWIYILPSLVSAYTVIVIRTNYKSVPHELIESAKLDGASEATICFRIVMPLSKAILATVGFNFLVGKWNDWNTAMVYIRNPDLYSLQYLLQRILRESEALQALIETDPNFAQEAQNGMPLETLRYAMALVAAGPMLFVFPFFQKYFSKGMTIGAVKG